MTISERSDIKSEDLHEDETGEEVEVLNLDIDSDNEEGKD